MRLRGSLTMFLVVLFSLAVVAAGCGGSDQADNQQDAGGKTSGGQDQQATSGGSGGETGQKGKQARENKIAVGKIINVNSEARRFVVKPAKGENMAFKAVSKARIKLDGKEVEMADMKRGQQVQLNYTIREEMGVPNRARSITLFNNEAGGGKTG